MEGLPARYILIITAFFGLFNLYALRVNLSVAIVAMVAAPPPPGTSDSANLSTLLVCPYPNSTISPAPSGKLGEFEWDGYTQGLVLSAFFWGYVITQFPGAWAAQRFGAKYVFGFSIFGPSLLSLLIPVLTRLDVSALIAVRFMQGFLEGVCFPATHTLLGKWLMPLERTKLSSITYSGAHLGTVTAMLSSGILAEHFGWDSIFYVFGALGCIWFGFWVYFAYDSPDTHPRISPEERDNILAALGRSASADNLLRPKVKPPWSQFARSIPFWATVVACFGNNWGFFTLLTSLPTFFARILHFRLSDNGFVSALPYLCLAILMPAYGFLADAVRSHHILSTTWTRRIFHFVGQAIPAASLVAVGYVGCDVVLAVALLVIALAGSGLAMVTFPINIIDISPTYAGILMGLVNTFGAIPGIAGPFVVGLLTTGEDGQTLTQWRYIFFIAAAIYLVTALFFFAFASGEMEPWEKAENGKTPLKRLNSCGGREELVRQPSP